MMKCLTQMLFSMLKRHRGRAQKQGTKSGEHLGRGHFNWNLKNQKKKKKVKRLQWLPRKSLIKVLEKQLKVKIRRRNEPEKNNTTKPTKPYGAFPRISADLNTMKLLISSHTVLNLFQMGSIFLLKMITS
jgi:hypothetical protein